MEKEKTEGPLGYEAGEVHLFSEGDYQKLAESTFCEYAEIIVDLKFLAPQENLWKHIAIYELRTSDNDGYLPVVHSGAPEDSPLQQNQSILTTDHTADSSDFVIPDTAGFAICFSPLEEPEILEDFDFDAFLNTDLDTTDPPSENS